jgi:hypothetical protein
MIREAREARAGHGEARQSSHGLLGFHGSCWWFDRVRTGQDLKPQIKCPRTPANWPAAWWCEPATLCNLGLRWSSCDGQRSIVLELWPHRQDSLHEGMTQPETAKRVQFFLALCGTSPLDTASSFIGFCQGSSSAQGHGDRLLVLGLALFRPTIK